MERPWTDADTLRELYWDRGMSLSEVADELDTGSSTIHSWMKKHNIERRRSTHEKPPLFRTTDDGYEVWRHDTNGSQYKVLNHRLLLTTEYSLEEMKEKEVHHKNRIPWDNRRSNIQLLEPHEHTEEHLDDFTVTIPLDQARECLYNRGSFSDLAEQLDIAPRTVSSKLKSSPIQVTYDPLDDPQVLQYMIDNGLSRSEIANEFDVSDQTVYKYLLKHNIKNRTQHQTVSDVYNPSKLRRLYFDEDYTMSEIAEEYNVTQGSVSQWFNKLDIDTGYKTSSPDQTPWRDEDWMRRQYIEHDKSYQQIADEFDCSYGVIQKWVHRHDLPVKE